jgi:hypothetical protein
MADTATMHITDTAAVADITEDVGIGITANGLLSV